MSSNPVLRAARDAEVYQVATRTPLMPARAVSAETGRTVLMKREDMQPVFSFKCRGAANCVAELVRGGFSGGVAAASAGNHAQGVAISARHYGLDALVVMPRTTPDVKIAAVRHLGAEVVLAGDTYDQARARLDELAEERGLYRVHPFDDQAIIVGQGTVGLEMIEQQPEPMDVVFVPTGGGGLLAGMAACIKGLDPRVRVVGVEPEDSNCTQAAMAAGERVVLDEVGLFTDGVAVRQVGEKTFPLIQQYCDEVITVSIDDICGGVRDLFEDFRVLAEPAGALAVAGIRRWCAEGRDGKVLAGVLSGANTNFERIGHIVERAALAAGHETLLCVQIPERPGSFLKLCDDLGEHNITEFNYRYSDDSSAQIFIGLGRRASNSGAADDAPAVPIRQHLEALGYEVLDLSDNEVARSHLRYMVGGRSRIQEREAVYALVFPERPGALKKFLRALGGKWNITIFHYRNHGSAYGRVFVGFDLGTASRAELEKDLANVGYRFRAENANPAYLRFLR